ncbi:MAG TPA: hypothetical protein DEH75_28930 [Bradyrhizobium sp.]|nr:hypothetical protein [Bradyrhizobium sp.]
MSANSVNRRRILSLWLPRLPIDRIKRKLAQDIASQAETREVDEPPASEVSTSAGLSPPLRGRVGERGEPRPPPVRLTPLPNPPPQGGREPIRWYVPNSLNESERKHDTG